MANAILTQNATLAPRLLADGSYMVDSRTSTLVAYKVRKLEHGWECNCEAAAYHRVCWHVTSVLALEAATRAPELVKDMVAITEHLQAVEGPKPTARKLRLEDLFQEVDSPRLLIETR